MSYQKVTGTLSQGAHPGSYNGQDAWNDMLVVEENDIRGITQLHDDRGGYDITPALCETDHKDPPVMAKIEEADMKYKCENCGEQFESDDDINGLSPAECPKCGEEKSITKQRKYCVRRLTPLECCRLQGFPDWWENGCGGSDSQRYRMWGNGVGLPCTAFVLSAIKKLAEMDGECDEHAD